MRRICSALVLALLLWAQPASAAFTLIVDVNGVSDGTHLTGTTAAVNTTGADLLVAVIGWYTGNGTSPLPLISDNKSNSWTYRTRQTGQFTSLRIAYAWNTGAKVGSGHTFTVADASGSNFAGFIISAWSGSQTSSDPFDTDAGTFNNSTTSLATGSAGANTDLAIAAMSSDAAATSKTIGSSFTISPNGSIDWVNNVNDGAGLAYKVQTGSDNPTWSWTGTSGAAATLASFKAAAGGGGGTSPPPCALRLLGVGCEVSP